MKSLNLWVMWLCIAVGFLDLFAGCYGWAAWQFGLALVNFMCYFYLPTGEE